MPPISAGLASGLIIYYNRSNPLNNEYYFLAILLLLFTVALIFLVFSSGKINKKEIKHPVFAITIVICFFILVTMFVLHIAPGLIPSFEITEPEEGDFVEVTSTVSGHGAIPGSNVKLYIADDIGNKWLQNTVNTTPSGDWRCEKVTFGKDRRDDIGKKFIIYATTLTKNNEIYETPHITVIRS